MGCGGNTFSPPSPLEERQEQIFGTFSAKAEKSFQQATPPTLSSFIKENPCVFWFFVHGLLPSEFGEVF